MISLGWICLGTLPKSREKMFENPHRKNLYPQKDMHHPKDVVKIHLEMDRPNL
jgi:hypothetical protein